MSKESIKILGLKELRKELKNFPLIKQAKILKAANMKAANKDVVKVLTPKIKHKTKVKGITKKGKITEKKQVIRKAVKGSKTAVNVGVSTDYYYYRFLEFGTKERFTKKRSRRKLKHKVGQRTDFKRLSVMGNKQSRGVLRARPFIGTILDKSIGKLVVTLSEEYGKQIDKAMKKTKGLGTNQNVTPYRVK